MKVLFARRAQQDLDAIVAYVRSHNPAAGRRVGESILNAVRNLATSPRAGRAQSISGLRKLVTRRYRYFIYYLVDDDADEVIIVAILHPARSRDDIDA